MKNILFLIVLCLGFVSCSSKPTEAELKAEAFEKALTASTGQEHWAVKIDTQKAGYVVYYNKETKEYVAYNMTKWDRKTMTTLDQYMALVVEGDIIGNLARTDEYIHDGYYRDIYDSWSETYTYEYYDEECDCYWTETVTEYYSEYVGQEWVDTSYTNTYFTGSGFRFDNTSTRSKDLDMIAALSEETAQKVIATKLASEFSLSVGRAEELAKLATRYKRMENLRELTSTEKDRFALDALGVSMTQVESALKKKVQGDEESYENMLKKASRVNNTTPEQIGKFFDELVLPNIGQ